MFLNSFYKSVVIEICFKLTKFVNVRCFLIYWIFSLNISDGDSKLPTSHSLRFQDKKCAMVILIEVIFDTHFFTLQHILRALNWKFVNGLSINVFLTSTELCIQSYCVAFFNIFILLRILRIRIWIFITFDWRPGI